MVRGAVTFSVSLTTASSICGSTTAWAPVRPMRAQKLLMASAGKPRRRRAVSVNSRGSSQSSTMASEISLAILRLETTV